MLWNLTSALLPPQDAQEQLTEGLRLHLRDGSLISILARVGTTKRSYLLVQSCPGCAQGRCHRGCQAALLHQLLQRGLPNCQLRSVDMETARMAATCVSRDANTRLLRRERHGQLA